MGAFSGSFANVILPDSIAGSVSTATGDLVLTVTAVASAGDANNDGSVDILDLDILGANWGQPDRSWDEGSFNGDGQVDILDLDTLGANWGGGAVPEPATMALLALGAVAMLRKRR